jgi:outer membrane protein TolC
VVAVEKIEIKPVSLEVEQLQSLALQNRPEYLQTLLQIEIAKQNVLVARNNRLWTLSLTGEYDVLGTATRYGRALRELGEDTERAWKVGLLLSIPIGDLTLKQGVINTQVALDQGRLREEEVRETIGTQVLDAVREVEVSLAQVTLARQVRELSEHKLDIEREKLRLGLTSNFQLISFQNDLANAQSQELRASIAYLNALTVLDRVLSTTLATWQIAIEDGR